MEYDVNDTSLGLEEERAVHTWLRAKDPVHWDAKNEAWLVTRNADIRGLLSQPARWSSARGYFPAAHMAEFKNSLITMDDPEHSRHRAILARAFTPRTLERLASRARDLMDDAIDAISDRNRCDLVESLAKPLPMRIIAEMVGFEDSESDEFGRLSEALFEVSSATAEDPTLLQRGLEAFSVLADHIHRAISDRRQHPRDDLLSVLVENAEAGVLETEDVLQFAVLLVSAGNETTRHTISWGMNALLDHPDQFAQLRSDPTRIPAAVEEWLRWASVVRGLKRTAVEDTVVGGRRIRRGEQVILIFPSANRDEDAFVRPCEFRIDREPNRHVAFGWGGHHCLGANLARLEMSVALRQMADRLPGLRFAPGATAIPKLTALTNGVERLDVTFDSVAPRSHADV